MKKCSRCKKEKPFTEFNFKKKAQEIRHKACKECTRQEIRKHYRENRKYYLDKTRRRNKQVMKSSKEFIWSYLIEHPCINCGEKDPIVLDFDHQGDKINNVSTMVKHKYSLETIKREIEKCVVRCANCHRRKTAKEFGWHKTTMRP